MSVPLSPGSSGENSPSETSKETSPRNALSVIREMAEAHERQKEQPQAAGGDLGETEVDLPVIDSEDEALGSIQSPEIPEEILNQLQIPPTTWGKELWDWLGDCQVKILTPGLVLMTVLEGWWVIDQNPFTQWRGGLIHGTIFAILILLGGYAWRRSRLDKTLLLNPKAKGGWTHLISAAKKGRLDVVRLLIESGANVNTVNSEHATALMWASQKGHIEVVRFLLEHGSDMNVRSLSGSTALGIAERLRNRSMIRLLKRAESLRKSKLLEPISGLMTRSGLRFPTGQEALKTNLGHKTTTDAKLNNL